MASTTSSVKIMAQFLTPLILCPLILYVSGETDSFPNDRLFEKIFTALFISSPSFPEICWEEIAKENFFFSYFALMPDLAYEPWLYVW